MKFNGLVLYSPTTEEAQLLRDILDIHLKSKPNIKEISKRNSKKKFFSTKYNFVDIDREVKYLSLGWDWYIGYKDLYTYPKGWANSLRKVVIMLNINTECYITPEQAKSIVTALEEYKNQ